MIIMQSLPVVDDYNLASISGIIAITLLAVEIIKRFVKTTTPILGRIPVMIWPLIIAPLLAFLANRILKTSSGTPLLAGKWYVVECRALLAAASSSGFYSWLRNPSITTGQACPLIGKDPNANANLGK